jgi:hypothetical protein
MIKDIIHYFQGNIFAIIQMLRAEPPASQSLVPFCPIGLLDTAGKEAPNYFTVERIHQWHPGLRMTGGCIWIAMW